jgi:hypothetical protein
MSEQTDLTKRSEAAIDEAIQRGKIPRASAASWRKGAQAGSDVRPALAMIPDNASVAAANAREAAEDPAMGRIMASFALPHTPGAAAPAPAAATTPPASSAQPQRREPSATVAEAEAKGAELALGLVFSRQMPPTSNGATLGIGSELAGAGAGS